MRRRPARLNITDEGRMDIGTVANIFRQLVRRAEEKVIATKLTMICIPDALSYQADDFIYDSKVQRIGCVSFWQFYPRNCYKIFLS